MEAGPGKTTVLWDESYLWGLIAHRTFTGLRVDFRLVSAADVRAGALDGCHVLFVPGGWAGDKMRALGAEGAAAIRDFVHGGGSYLGFCGGAGLALAHADGLGLAPVSRLSSRQRLPSFSGNIELLHAEPAHPLWQGIGDGTPFHAWWPGQFAIDGNEQGITVLATYGRPGFDAFVTDLPVSEGMQWDAWEERYGIDLDPGRIAGEPAVIETSHGRGKVILSYIHFETPGDKAGYRVLLNILRYLAGGREVAGGPVFRRHAAARSRRSDVEPDAEAVAAAADMAATARSFYRFGHEHLLWYRRRDWLLQWRRGVRGTEYSTLEAMLKEIAEVGELAGGYDPESNRALKSLVAEVESFYADARRLLMRERLAMTRGPLSPLRCEDQDIQELRRELFSTDRRCGGRYRRLLEVLDPVLLKVLRRLSGTDS